MRYYKDWKLIEKITFKLSELAKSLWNKIINKEIVINPKKKDILMVRTVVQIVKSLWTKCLKIHFG